MAVKVDSNLCSGCGACVEQCPCEAISMKAGVAIIDEAACSDCGSCIGECPNEAISE